MWLYDRKKARQCRSIAAKPKPQFESVSESELESVAFTDPVILVNWNFIFSFRTQTHPYNTHTYTHTRAHSHTLIKRHKKKFICHDATAVATLATLCSYHFNSPVPNHASILIPPIYPAGPVCCCRLPLNGICRLCVTHAGHYPSTAAFRFLWNLRLCLESPLPSLLLVYFFFFSCLWPFSASALFSKVDMLPAWLKVFSACLLFCAPSIWFHTHTQAGLCMFHG